MITTEYSLRDFDSPEDESKHLLKKQIYWTYTPKVIPPFVFEPLLCILQDYCVTASSSTRRSCVFNGIHEQTLEFNYGKMAIYPWKYVPSIISDICRIIENVTQQKYDYVLVHIYPEGSSSISWHSDSEARESTIASLSLGATRKFRLRTIGRTQGWDHEIKLNDGDLIVMHGPDPTTGRKSCQEVYQHSVPVEKKVKGPRINMTFRQY